MSFDYDRISKNHDHGSWWTSYADLFMMLSIVFLLMFVASSLRNGSAGFQQQKEFNRLSQRAADLEEQIRVYNTLKEDVLQKQASTQEQEVYEKLMGKLDLLQEQATDEKRSLETKAKENADKAFALNQYQQLVRNIINSNVLAKSQILRRDKLIVSKDATIEEKRQKLNEMENVVAKNNAQIASMNSELGQKIQALRKEQLKSRTSKVILEKRIAALKTATSNKIQELQQSNHGIVSELNQVKGTLGQTEEKLGQATQTIQQQQAQLAGERAAFEAKLKKQHLSAAVHAKKMAEFLRQEQAKLAGSEAEKNRALASVEGLKGDLARTQEIANARKKLAQQITQRFASAGIPGAVDARTGEVTLDFGGQYFDTGSTELKPVMRTTLDQFVPVYAKSLFSDPKIAEKIASVEIVGFASSTYLGRYVNPKSSKPEDRAAIEYNLKLSFGRANSIFKHVLNKTQLSPADRQHLMPLLKVVGRGYLPEGKTEAEMPDNLSEKDFCLRFNCKKAQKVILKFNMKD